MISSKNSADYTEKITKSEADVTKMHLVLVLEGLDPIIVKAYDCLNIWMAFEDIVTIAGRYARIDVDIKRDDDWSIDKHTQEIYKATSLAWLSTLDRIWSTQRMIITTPILKHAQGAYREHIYTRINNWPFLGAMLRPDSECELTILSTIDHIVKS